ncbi:hypothetical protein PYW08_010630 [Mythimna loreyi]|uniref:Uncharacterized protein n=1 Tax=Mythimna loreyi TaxID=667449 RepID=A0ACC2Q3I7_9NEOP|nr:hypothetical protein PYW08_010630 [Mythimna loreyi]
MESTMVKMGTKTVSYRSIGKDKTEDSSADVERPKPNDFDVFVPWACREYRVDANVIVTRGVQAIYISAASTAKKHITTVKRKLSMPPSVVTQEHSMNVDFETSEIDQLVPEVTEKIVKIETVYDSNENLVQIKFLNNKYIPRKVMQVVALTIPFQRHLTSITINSGFDVKALYEMSKFLPVSLITEICLDGTFVREANYHILLEDSNLKHISLARCMISDSILKSIAEQLKEPCAAAKTLSALNLSTNKITDTGAKYLADVLRANRHLSYLNLAGNMITDEGGASILNTLQKFPLQFKELFESRGRYMEYLKKKRELVNMFVIDLHNATGKNYRKKTLKKATKVESLCWQQHYEIAEAQIIQEKAESLAETKLGLFNEPFSPNNTETQDGVVYCLGNNTLAYLNLAYNNLTYISVKKLLEVLKTQKYLYRAPKGLIKVVIDGNLMPASCEEYIEISALLASGGIPGYRKPSEASKKKPLTARYIAK